MTPSLAPLLALGAGLAVLLVLLKWWHPGLLAPVVSGIIRSFVQLSLLGFALVWLFEIHNLWGLLAILGGMTLFASHTAAVRTGLPRGFWYAALILTLSAFPLLALLVATDFITPTPAQLIPLGGMILGNTLNAHSLFADRAAGEIRGRLGEAEGYIALGTPLRRSLLPMMRAAAKTAATPLLNNLQTVGIVLIPGMAVGMLLAGADPAAAIFAQLVILYAILLATFLAVFFTGVILPKPLIRKAYSQLR